MGPVHPLATEGNVVRAELAAGRTLPPATPWPTPAALPPLEWNEVHAWVSPLHISWDERIALAKVLDTEERDRANRFRFPKHRWEFVVARGTLKEVIGRYLGFPADQVHLGSGAKGKPYLLRPETSIDLRFNLSHSGDYFLIGVAKGRELGIDIERMRPDLADDGMARTSFSEREVTAFRALPPEFQERGFFSCWSRKEAFIKATGEGVSYGLQDFDVSLAPGEEPKLLGCRRDVTATSRWMLRALDPVPGYAAALVAEGHDWRVRCFHWPSERTTEERPTAARGLSYLPSAAAGDGTESRA
jgi:4'-phosphopantetheinyl transferase